MGKKIFYGFGGLSYSVIGQTIASLFMFFSTSVLHLSGALVGLAIAISTIWDCLCDSFFGYLSDNKRLGKLGYRNGYMLIACVGMSIFNLFLWCTPNDIGDFQKFLWVLVMLIALETFNTLFATPYSALGNELAESADERTKINATSTVFNLIGIMIPSVLLVIFLPDSAEYPIGQLNPKGYVNIAIVTSLICLIFGIASSLLAFPKDIRDKKCVKFALCHIIKSSLLPFKNKGLRKLILGYSFTTIATVFLCSVGLHFFTYSFLYNSTQITILLLTLMLGTIVSQPLWVYVSKKNKKKSALLSGIVFTILSVFGVILIYLFRLQIYNVSFYFMILSIFCCGLGSGSIYCLPLSMYGDAIVKMSKGGEGMIATYSGTLSLAGNIATSITQLLVGILLDIVKFDSTMQIQTLGVQMGISLILFIGVQLSLLTACFIFGKYREKN